MDRWSITWQVTVFSLSVIHFELMLFKTTVFQRQIYLNPNDNVNSRLRGIHVARCADNLRAMGSGCYRKLSVNRQITQDHNHVTSTYQINVYQLYKAVNGASRSYEKQINESLLISCDFKLTPEIKFVRYTFHRLH